MNPLFALQLFALHRGELPVRFRLRCGPTPAERFRHIHRLKNNFIINNDVSDPFSRAIVYVPSTDPESLAADFRRAEGERGEPRFEIGHIDGFVVLGTPGAIQDRDTSERRTPARELFENNSGLASVWLSAPQLRIAQGIGRTLEYKGLLPKASPQQGIAMLRRALAYLENAELRPLELEDLAVVIGADGDKGLNVRMTQTHTTTLRDPGASIALSSVEVPTITPPNESKVWMDASFAIDTAQREAALITIDESRKLCQMARPK